jgi:hypothetical protein
MEKWICNKIGLKSQGWEAVVSVGLDGLESVVEGMMKEEETNAKCCFRQAFNQSMFMSNPLNLPIIFYQTGYR